MKLKSLLNVLDSTEFFRIYDAQADGIARQLYYGSIRAMSDELKSQLFDRRVFQVSVGLDYSLDIGVY